MMAMPVTTALALEYDVDEPEEGTFAPSSSGWEGNVALAAHNRGKNSFFGQIHTLQMGARIIYSTQLGTRTYEVFSVKQVSETDMSCLDRTSENIITLVTCVRDVRDMRWCVQAREVA